MDDTSKRRPRLSVEIDEDLQKRLQKRIPYGLQSTIFRTIAEGLLDLLEKSPVQQDLVIAAFLSRDITVLDLIKRMVKHESKRSEEEHQGDDE